jgi:hypothetical protein
MEKSEFNRRVNQDIKALIKQGVIGLNTELEHLLLDDNTMICKHCGTTQQVKMRLSSWDELDDTFAKFQDFHKHCEKPVATNTRKPITGVDEIAKQALTIAVNDGYHSGFDHGCDYILHEAEYWVREDKGTLADFVVYLKDFKKG